MRDRRALRPSEAPLRLRLNLHLVLLMLSLPHGGGGGGAGSARTCKRGETTANNPNPDFPAQLSNYFRVSWTRPGSGLGA